MLNQENANNHFGARLFLKSNQIIKLRIKKFVKWQMINSVELF